MVQTSPVLKLPQKPFRVTLLRFEDLLCLEFEFINLKLDTSGKPARLVPQDASEPCYLVVRFPPQHIAEEAFVESLATNNPLARPPIRARLAGKSQLVWAIPPEIKEIPYTTQALLDWTRFSLNVAPVAKLRLLNAAVPTAPILTASSTTIPVTAIELPYRLLLSPSEAGQWRHALTPVTRDGRTELWHTRLAESLRIVGRRTDSLRAIWAQDGADPFTMSLTASDRQQLVQLTSNFSIQNYQPQPIQVERLMLSALGGWLRSQANFSPPSGLSIEEWRHIATMGRDHFVRVVKRGFLYPFGHRAVKIEITERKFLPQPGSSALMASLQKRTFIVVREPIKSYFGSGYEKEGREMPFKRIQIRTLITPPLNPAFVGIAGFTDKISWVQTGNRDLPFHLVATDWDGQTVEFNAALIFIEADLVAGANLQTVLSQLSNTYRQQERRRCDLQGQKVAFAEKLSGTASDATLTTQSLYFDTQIGMNLPAPFFLPKLDKAIVTVPAVEQLLGTNQPVTIQLHDRYLNKQPNSIEVFAKLSAPLALNNLSAEKAGGLATLNMAVSGLSRTLGPIASSPARLDLLAGGDFDVTDIFGNNKLLGCISLKDLITSTFDPSQLPKLLSQTLTDASGQPNRVETSLSWSPTLKSTELLDVSHPQAKLTIDALIQKKLDGSPPESRVHGRLSKFTLKFFDVLEVAFESLEFKSEQGRKLDVNADINDFTFLGALAFINDLRKYIPQDGFSDPPSLDVSPRGVEVGYSLGIPPIAIGVFSLQNVSLSAGLFIPFTSEPASLSFAFCERYRPFLLSVSIFGGGGYFGVQTGLDGIRSMDGALEFGGVLALNLGVASGAIQLMAGIYFKLDQNGATLTGYVRLLGAVQVLGLICVSIEFYMALTYVTQTGLVEGMATVTVKVEVLFFEKSVSMTVKKTFAGSAPANSASALRPNSAPAFLGSAVPMQAFRAQRDSRPPSFTELMSQQDWDQYATAFA